MERRITFISCLFGMLIGFPLIGVALAGKSLKQFLEFPPITRYVNHPPFSWKHFILGFFILLFLFAPFLPRVFGYLKNRDAKPVVRREGKFPWWGFAAVTSGLISWFLAWNRFAWFEPFQSHTFTPLWLSYILAVNACSYKRSGKCMLINERGYFLLLFPTSIVFWWFFEYLNRFVQNWYYLGATRLSASEYVFHASISFSTVLPAVLGTRELLLTYPFFQKCFSHFIPIRPPYPKTFAFITLLISLIGLANIGTHPDYAYSLLWISPLIVIVSLQTILGEKHILSDISAGDWTMVISSSAAGLICGFFWEMWNYHSFSKWVYSIPYVHKFVIFEMPILGYAGYLPFGLICVAVGNILKKEGGEK